MLKKLRRKFILINMMPGESGFADRILPCWVPTSQSVYVDRVSPPCAWPLKWAEGIGPPQIELLKVDLPEGGEPGSGTRKLDARQLAMVLPVFGVVLDENGNIDSYAPRTYRSPRKRWSRRSRERSRSRGVPEGTITKPGHLRYLVEWDRMESSALPLPIVRWEWKT